MDGASMFAHDPVSNGKTKTTPGGIAHVLCWSDMGAGLIDLVEAFEEMGQVRGFDASVRKLLLA